ncbi:hypothetical protein ACPCSP_25225 [Streptomyces cinereoruber]|uniref:hypothetical protein n=1 Tax=Streptomyces cinereoruber TaxID=67260 RepID=UPI003C2F6548
MSLDTLPIQRGLRVPKIARWSAEQDITPRVYPVRGRLVYRDGPLTRASTVNGALWRVWSLAPGRGEALLSHVHPARQRRMMRLLLCQVCGKPTSEEAAREGGHLFLTGAGPSAGMRGPITEGEPVTSPPLHLPCAWESVRHCRHLLEGYSAARVATPVQWGVYGILHEQVSATDVIAVDIGAQVPYGARRLGMLLAGQAVVELHGARSVDLVAEAARAGLPGSEAGR